MTKENIKVLEKLNKAFEERRLMEMPDIPTVLYTERIDPTDGQRKKFYVNLETAERGFDLDAIIDTGQDIKLVKRGSNVPGFVFAYDEEFDMLVFFLAYMDTHMPKKDQVVLVPWHEHLRIYIDRDKNTYSLKSYGNSFLFCEGCPPWLKTSKLYMEQAMYSDPDKLFEPVWKLFPKMVVLGASNARLLNQMWVFVDFLKYKDLKRKEGPKQEATDRLATEYPLKNPSVYEPYTEDAVEAKKKKNSGYYPAAFSDTKMAVFERVDCDEPTVCLRGFVVECNTKDFYEYCRVYFTKNDIVSCKSDNRGGFIYMPFYNNPGCWSDMNLMKYDEGDMKGTMLEYFGDIINSVEEDKKWFYLWSLAGNPLLEKLWKAGYSDYVNLILGRSLCNEGPGGVLADSFGTFNKKENSVYSMLGTNKYQTDVLIPEMVKTKNHRLAVWTKYILEGKLYLTHDNRETRMSVYDHISIRNVDRGVFDAVADFVFKVNEISEQISGDYFSYSDIRNRDLSVDRVIDIATKISKAWGLNGFMKARESLLMVLHYGIDTAVYIHDITKKREAGEIGVHEHRRIVCNTYIHAPENTYYDYVDMIIQMELMRQNKPCFADLDELKRLHDNTSRYFKIKKDEMAVKKLKESLSRIKKFEFRSDYYNVISPSSPDDFLREGHELGHCVGSYLERVLRGSTNVMFIRKNDEPNKPFFTVEISDSGVIEQIHGFGNRNLDTEPDLIPFIKEWQDERGVSLHGIDKIR